MIDIFNCGTKSLNIFEIIFSFDISNVLSSVLASHWLLKSTIPIPFMYNATVSSTFLHLITILSLIVTLI